MGIKEIIIIQLCLFISISSISQNCGEIEKLTKSKIRKYYILDSCCSSPNFAEIKQYIDPKDTLIVHQIIEKGFQNDDYFYFFKQHGIVITKIGFKKYKTLPFDTITLSKREKRLERELDSLYRKSVSLIAEGKSPEFLNKKLERKKYIKLQKKISVKMPYLLRMYPIYTHNSHELVMYYLITKFHEWSFFYQICTN